MRSKREPTPAELDQMSVNIKKHVDVAVNLFLNQMPQDDIANLVLYLTKVIEALTYVLATSPGFPQFNQLDKKAMARCVNILLTDIKLYAEEAIELNKKVLQEVSYEGHA